jgi:nucleotide-binding universal stress UspA family protein
MNSISRLLVCLAGRNSDDAILKYTGKLAEVLPVQKIYFLHAVRSLEIPKETMKEFGDVLAPLDEAIIRDVENQVNQHFDISSIDYEIDVREGKPAEIILKWAKIKQVDLVLIGREPENPHPMLKAGRVAGLSTTSVLFIPNDVEPKIENILVGLDFSENASLGLNAARSLSEKSGARVEGVHVYNLPQGYYKTGKSKKDFAAIMEKHARKEASGFMKDSPFPELDITYLLNEGSRTIKEEIIAYAHRQETDLLIIGSKGRSPMAAVLLGSVAEQCLKEEQHIPILIVKKPNENMNFFQALMKV